MSELSQSIQVLLLVTGGIFLVGQMVFRPAVGTVQRKVMLAILTVFCLVSVFSYTKFGKFHERDRDGLKIFHYHDIWHYAVGAKYYPELGYDSLYDCTTVALADLRAEGRRVPQINEVRVLAAPMEHYTLATEAERLDQECHARFSDARWQAFKADQSVWLDMHWAPRWWQTMMFDLGFNPPPTWNVIAHPLIEMVPISRTTLQVLPFIDLILVFGVGSFMVWRAWGAFAMGGYLLVLGANIAAAFSWTGGSYGRHLWFAALVCGLSTLELKRWKTAGVLVGLAACMRIFPAVFVAGAGLALLGMLWRKEIDRKAVLEFTGAGVATGLVLTVASLILFDPSLWADFFHKIKDHGDTYFVWHIGFKKWATWSSAAAAQNFWWGEGLDRFRDWNVMLDQNWHNGRLVYEPIRLGMVATSAVLAWRMKPARAALLFGGTTMFCMTIPANYYYVWLALIPAVFIDEEGGWESPLQVATLFCALTGMAMTRWISPDGLIQNHWWNTLLLAFFVVWIGSTVAAQVAAHAPARDMVRRHYVRFLAVGAAVFTLMFAVSKIDMDPRKNLVIILIDTMRADRFGTYGHDRPTSPNIDAFADESTVFEHAYSHAPWTAPSVASVMTSLPPRDHGLIDWDMALAPQHLTLAEHLHSEGYQTMATISHVVFREALGFKQGFEKYNTKALELGHPEKAVSSKVVADEAIQQLKQRNTGKPFFLWTHFFDPHFQYITHKGMEFGPENRRGQPMIEQWSDAYDSEVAFTDRHVGRLLKYLKREGLLDDSVVALLADHGEEFGDHGGERHSIKLFDEVVRVPLILRVPGFKPGRVPQVVPTSDLGPTVLPLLGVGTPPNFRGVAVPVVDSRFAPTTNRPVILETVRYADKRGLVEWPWKLIQDRETNTSLLFNVEDDPAERTNLMHANGDVARDLRAKIDAHYDVDRMEAPSREISDEELEQLRALGYLDDH